MNTEAVAVRIMNVFGERGYQRIRRLALKNNRKWLVVRSDLFRFSIGKTPYHVEEFREVVTIHRGLYEYEYFNICFLNDMFSFILQAISEHRLPRIEIINSNGENIWEQFFLQPFPEVDTAGLRQVDAGAEYMGAFPQFDEIFSPRCIGMWGRVYQEFLKYNPPTRDYIERELSQVLGEGKRVLGVLCRGTDYTDIKPKGHPVQPELDQVLRDVEKKLQEARCESIYLATEDGKIDALFRERFPGRILTNQRMYYDEIFRENNLTLIKDVHFERENDDYRKGVEYLSSLVICAHCDVFVAGNCGGSQAAVFMNCGQYEDLLIYNLGLYE